MFASAAGERLIGAMIDEFMDLREQYAPRYTIRRQVLDGAMSATVIDRGCQLMISGMSLERAEARVAKDIISNLLKLLYDLESRRFEQGGHTDGLDFTQAAKRRAINYFLSRAMSDMAAHDSSLSLWNHSEAREATRRFGEYLWEEHGHEHNQHPPSPAVVVGGCRWQGLPHIRKVGNHRPWRRIEPLHGARRCHSRCEPSNVSVQTGQTEPGNLGVRRMYRLMLYRVFDLGPRRELARGMKMPQRQSLNQQSDKQRQ